MDDSRFDALTKRISRLITRRGLLQGGLTGLLTTVTARSAVEEASALACIKPGRRGCRGPRNRTCCTGSVCRGGSETRTGRCVCRGRKQRPCKGRCVRIDASPNCGACGRKCRYDQICFRKGAGYGCRCPGRGVDCHGRCFVSGEDYQDIDPVTRELAYECCTDANCAGSDACIRGLCRCTTNSRCPVYYARLGGYFEEQCCPNNTTACCFQGPPASHCCPPGYGCCRLTVNGVPNQAGCIDPTTGQCIST